MAFILFSALPLTAQQVTGRVDDDEGQPIPFANVALWQKADSTLLSGTTTDDAGLFSLEVQEREKCFLQISHIGYETETVEITSSSLSITLKPVLLGEVKVTGERIKRNASVDIYYIADSIRKASANTLQLLGKLQGISIDWATDGVKIGEYRDVPMMVEGRDVGAEYIRNLNPERIRRVEVLRYPKGKYGDAPIVLDIILNNAYTGFDMGVHAKGLVSLRNNHSYSTDDGVTFTYATERWNLYGDAGVKSSRIYNATSYGQTYGDASESTATEDYNHPNGSNRLTNLSFTAGVDYKINTEHTLSLQAWISDGRGKDKEAYNDDLGSFFSRSLNGYDAVDFTVGAYYKGTVARKLHLSGDVTYNRYDVDEHKVYTQLADVSDRLYEGKKEFWRANVDGNYRWSDVVGATLGYTFTDKEYADYERPTGSRLFSTLERRHDAYFSVTVNPARNFNLVVGSDFLYVDERSDTLSAGNFSWMPVAKAYWRPFKRVSLYADYFCDVSHPNLDQLSTVAYQRNAFLWHAGNPTLKANVMHYMQLRMDLHDIVQFTYLYKHSSREITPWYDDGGDYVMESLANGNYVHQYAGLDGDYSLPHGIGLNFTANYQWYKRRLAEAVSWQRGHTWCLDVTATWQANSYLALMAA
ncbi:MAG: TonB-dependent receptor [Prevotellaceae bacterium]|nr:TonB-dependent receptor [Prevotellaceae bacterium]